MADGRVFGRRGKGRRRAGTAAVLTASLSTLLSLFPASAQALVNIAPATYVPYLPGTDNYVYAADDVGGTTYVGGAITSVFAPSTGTTSGRSSLFAYSDGTGALSPFAPTFDGPVWSISHSADGLFLYVGGNFSHVNGFAIRGLVRFSLATGQVDTGFNARLNGWAQAVQVWNGQVIIGGAFTSAGGAPRTAMASLDPTTGAATSYVNLAFAGVVSSNAGATGVRRFAINTGGSRLVAIGNFTSVGGQSRWRATMLDLGATSATLDTWNAPILQQQCSSSEPNYLWDVKFSPDGSYFVFVSTGYFGSGPVFTTVCDAASRFETTSLPNATYTWANYTGGDSLYAAAVTSDAVYVAGHQRWLDNPKGRDSAGVGAQSRPGIGAIDPTTGKALSWNPTRSRGRGAKMLLVETAGLLVGSDCSPSGNSSDPSSGALYYNSKFHPCLALAPGA